MSPRGLQAKAYSVPAIFAVIALQVAVVDTDAVADDDAYCGLYCVHAALTAVGLECDFHSLLRPQYIGSNEGSTLDELRHAVDDLGGYAIPLTRLSADSLRTSRHPMILHVASEGQLNRYQHWVLFLGIEHGQTRIFDPASSRTVMPLSDLMARWDGTALVVSDQPITADQITSREQLGLAAMFVLGMIVVGLIHSLRAAWAGGRATARDRPVRVVICAQAVVLLIASAAISLGSHNFDSEGFLQNKSATSYVAALTLKDYLPTVSRRELEQIVEERPSETLIVDARSERSFSLGHIQGAINVPVRMAFEPLKRSKVFEKVAKSHRIIIYCQSLGCGYDEKLGAALVSDGFTNVSLFPDGWREWKRSE